jgi:hypothetical protein
VIGTQTGDWRQILGPAIGGRRRSLAIGISILGPAIGGRSRSLAIGDWDSDGLNGTLGVGNLERRDRERRRREGDAIENERRRKNRVWGMSGDANEF